MSLRKIIKVAFGKVSPEGKTMGSASAEDAEPVSESQASRDAGLTPEFAKDIVLAGIREHNRIQNRAKWKRRGLLTLIAIGIIGIFKFSGGEPPSVPVRKSAWGLPVAIAGAAPGASKTGRIVAVKLDGEIGGRYFGDPSPGNTPRYLAETYRAIAANTDNLVAVVLLIDSPGGGAAASANAHRITRSFNKWLAEKKIPFVTYISEGAFSGGYFIAMGTEKVYADPEASVANIGVIMHLFNASGFGEMFGVGENIIATGPLKSTGSTWEKLSAEQRAMLEHSIEAPFNSFLSAVSASRGIPLDVLKRESKEPTGRTNGAWFSADDAVENKLIDGVISAEDFFQTFAASLPDEVKATYRDVQVEMVSPEQDSFKILKKSGRALGEAFAEGLVAGGRNAAREESRIEMRKSW